MQRFVLGTVEKAPANKVAHSSHDSKAKDPAQ